MNRMPLRGYLNTHCGGSQAEFARKFDMWPQNVHKIFKDQDDQDLWSVFISDSEDNLVRKTKDGKFIVTDNYAYEILGTSKK